MRTDQEVGGKETEMMKNNGEGFQSLRVTILKMIPGLTRTPAPTKKTETLHLDNLLVQRQKIRENVKTISIAMISLSY